MLSRKIEVPKMVRICGQDFDGKPITIEAEDPLIVFRLFQYAQISVATARNETIERAAAAVEKAIAERDTLQKEFAQLREFCEMVQIQRRVDPSPSSATGARRANA